MENQQSKATYWSEIRNHLGKGVSKLLATTVNGYSWCNIHYLNTAVDTDSDIEWWWHSPAWWRLAVHQQTSSVDKCPPQPTLSPSHSHHSVVAGRRRTVRSSRWGQCWRDWTRHDSRLSSVNTSQQWQLIHSLLSRRFFKGAFYGNQCLLPDKRDLNITDRLRYAKTFTSFSIRTERFRKSFLPYCLNLYD